MHLIEEHILRKVNGNAVLVPLRETDFNGMIVLNQTAEFVCKMLQQDTDTESLVAQLAHEYAEEPNRIKADVEAFLAQLDGCNMLIR